MEYKFTPKELFKFQLAIILILVFLSLAVSIFRLLTGHDVVFGLIPLFDVNQEANIPSFYSSLAILASSFLLYLVCREQKKEKKEWLSWLVLSVVFMFLGVDEFASLHEQLTGPVRSMLSTDGLLYYAWVIPYAIILFLLIPVFMRFLINLPNRIRFLFFVSGVVYVLGAMGMELLGGELAQSGSEDTVKYVLFYTLEEFLEMLGIAIFIYAILSYLIGARGIIRLSFCSESVLTGK